MNLAVMKYVFAIGVNRTSVPSVVSAFATRLNQLSLVGS